MESVHRLQRIFRILPVRGNHCLTVIFQVLQLDKSALIAIVTLPILMTNVLWVLPLRLSEVGIRVVVCAIPSVVIKRQRKLNELKKATEWMV